MNYVARASGAALGFIAGDLPGALAGYRFGDAAYKWSRGTPKSLPNMQTPPGTTRKRARTSNSGSRSVSRGRRSARGPPLVDVAILIVIFALCLGLALALVLPVVLYFLKQPVV